MSVLRVVWGAFVLFVFASLIYWPFGGWGLAVAAALIVAVLPWHNRWAKKQAALKEWDRRNGLR